MEEGVASKGLTTGVKEDADSCKDGFAGGIVAAGFATTSTGFVEKDGGAC